MYLHTLDLHILTHDMKKKIPDTVLEYMLLCAKMFYALCFWTFFFLFRYGMHVLK